MVFTEQLTTNSKNRQVSVICIKKAKNLDILKFKNSSMFSEPCFPFSAPRHALSQSDFGNRARENDGRERKKTTKSEISRRGLVQTDQTTVDTRDFNFFRAKTH